ncbi:Uncharacterised protein [Mycobacteroides abscessus subsp. abscessus]|uniref:hypothetical protein n=1 Tax=Mycobacteroides abscessus TaxID=36809 RepID=UPI0009297D81|nr:hypothetical protein [Mycobacteroides abscessus]SHX67145.1 Uncharacterised protein [Mycobacteroides abscessus subsp. abscessus]SIC59383.1 Uncharacterised protein [Mycobacteroides abscessus subsp. abscessus]SKK20174.1 Uncharacterised protein [Mycobacteroides abscessus subsp. abscessus]SKP49942.1 Uncharacterised protein [Mycobacteroides abscessus subsp. abscessus]SKR42031.1 Uncharacterised protein [Mycobacteroides abscessus subsp. abscessus]
MTTSHGWTNDATWATAGACENTQEFVEVREAVIDTARSGDVDLAAANLANAVRGTMLATLPSWVQLDEVDWAQLVTRWAEEED